MAGIKASTVYAWRTYIMHACAWHMHRDLHNGAQTIASINFKPLPNNRTVNAALYPVHTSISSPCRMPSNQCSMVPVIFAWFAMFVSELYFCQFQYRRLIVKLLGSI